MEQIKDYLDGLLRASAPDRPAWNIEVALGHIPPSWNYIDGCMLKAVFEMYAITGDGAYLDFATEFIDYYVDGDGTIAGYRREDYNCDNINEGKILFDLHRITGREKYLAAIRRLYVQIEEQPRTSEGNFWHKKIYPNQVWLDGLYMVQPFYMEYQRLYDGNRSYRDIFSQFETVYRRMRDPATGLLYHGYDEGRTTIWADPNTGCSPNFWGRSLGWYAMALIDTLEKMDEQFFYEYQTLQDYAKEVLDALMAFSEPATGLIWQVVDAGEREGNYLETSGSCAVAYSLMKGARLGFFPAVYFQRGERIFQSVVEQKLTLLPDGGAELRDICLVAGLGGMPGRGGYAVRDGSYAYYISEPRVANDAKGVAPFLLAFTEVYRRGLER